MQRLASSAHNSFDDLHKDNNKDLFSPKLAKIVCVC
jgi:hypothetical protein